MWYILIEIDGLPQIEKIDASLYEKVTSRLERILAPPMFRYLGKRGGIIAYIAEAGTKKAEIFVEQLKRLDALLRGQSEIVESYSVVVRGGVEVQTLGADPLLSEVVRFVYDVPEEDGLWCDEATAHELFPRAGLRKRDGFYLYVAEDTEVLKERSEFSLLFERYIPVDEVFDRFTPLLNGEKRGVFHLIGPKGSGKRSVVKRIKALIRGESFSLPWLDFQSESPVFSGITPLLDSIRSDFIEKVPNYLTKMEAGMWRRLSPLLNWRRESIVENDGLLLLDLYISAYVRYMESIFFPPIIACFNIDGMHHRSSEILRMLMARTFPGQGPVWITTAESDAGSSGKPEQGESEREDEKVELHALLEERRIAANEERGVEGTGDYSRYPLFAPYHEFVCHNAFEKAPAVGECPTEILVFQLPREDRSLLYGLSLLPRSSADNIYRDLCNRIGLEEDNADRRLEQLAMYRLVHPEDHLLPLFPELFIRAATGDADNDQRVREGVMAALQRREVKDGELSTAKIALSFEKMEAKEEALEYLFQYASELLFLENKDELQEIADRVEKLLPDARDPQKVYRGRYEGLHLYIALDTGNEEAVHEHFRNLPTEPAEPKSEHEKELYAKWILSRGEYLWRMRNYREALDAAKEALLRFQNLSLPEWEVRSHLLLGKIMLSLQRVEEAVEYFHNAGQKSLDDIYYSLICESSAFIALNHVILGDYSLALSYAESAGQRAAERGRRKWERYLGMMRGKLLCELGRYEEASEVFQRLLLHERLYFDNLRNEHFIAWLSRCRMYQGFIEVALARLSELEETPEHLFFTAEAHLLNRNFENAKIALDRALEVEGSDNDFIYPISLLHRDGYDPFENVILKKPGSYDVLYQLIRAVRGFVLFRLGKTSEADEEFNEILEAEKRVKMDPYRHLYYFFRTIAHDNGDENGELTRETYLSKAFQNLQKTSGRITDPADRRSYLTRNYWNSKLFAMSKEHKLV